MNNNACNNAVLEIGRLTRKKAEWLKKHFEKTHPSIKGKIAIRPSCWKKIKIF